MLDKRTLNKFISKVNHAHQYFWVWMHTNNLYVKHRGENECLKNDINFWEVMIFSCQDSWILSTARLFDPPNFMGNEEKSRLSVYYLLKSLDDNIFEKEIKIKLDKHKNCIESIKNCRDDVLAHNNVNAARIQTIEAGIENLFEELDKIILEIEIKTRFNNCNCADFKNEEEFCKNGVERIFKKLLTK